MEMPAWFATQGFTDLDSVACHINTLRRQLSEAERREKLLRREIAELKAGGAWTGGMMGDAKIVIQELDAEGKGFPQ